MRLTQKQLMRVVGTGILLVCLIGINIYILRTPEVIAQLQSVGLSGLLLLSILSGFNVVVPIPIAVLYPSVAALGYPAVVIVSIIALGMTLGDSIGYILGMGIRSLVQEQPGRLQRYMLRYTDNPVMLVVFILIYGMIIPLPNELIVIPLAAMHVPWYLVLLPLFVGNIVFTILLAAGATGITQLLV